MIHDSENHALKLLQDMRDELREMRAEMRAGFEEVSEQFDDVNTRIDGVAHILTLLAAHSSTLENRVSVPEGAQTP